MVGNNSAGRGKKPYTVLERENCSLIASGSLEELIKRLGEGDILVAAGGKSMSESLAQVRKEQERMEKTIPVIALAPPEDISALSRVNLVSDVLAYPPNRFFLAARVKHYLEHAGQAEVVNLLSPTPKVIVNEMFDDLKNKRIDDCMKKVYYLCEKIEGDEKVSANQTVSDALFSFLTTTVKEKVNIPGIELNAVSTDAFYSAYGHPPLMKAFGGCFKRYFKERRAKCELLSLIELEKRQEEHNKTDVLPEISLLNSKRTLVNTVRLKNHKLISADGEIYLHKEYVDGPNLNNIASEIRTAIDTNERFAAYFAHAVRFYMNECLASLQTNPLPLGKVRRTTQEYYQQIRDMFSETLPHMKIRMSEEDHHALRTAIKSYLEPLVEYEPMQYFDMCAKNIMFKVNGAYNSRFEVIQAHFRNWSGVRNESEITMAKVLEYVKEVAVKIDWNKTYRMHHPADDARHEMPALPISSGDSDILNLHMWAVKEKERLTNELEEKVKNNTEYRIASPQFDAMFSKINSLDKLANQIALNEIEQYNAQDELQTLLSPDTLHKFEEYRKGVPAAWLYRAMRTFGLTLQNYLPAERKRGADARREMTSCYRDRSIKKLFEDENEGMVLEDKIAEIIQRVDVPDRRPFVGGNIFIPTTKGDADKLIAQEKVDGYVKAANQYFQSYSNEQALKNEMSFCLRRIQTLLDNVIMEAPEALSEKDYHELSKSINNSSRYMNQMLHIRKTYTGADAQEVRQYAGALYLRKFINKILNSKSVIKNYLPRRDAS